MSYQVRIERKVQKALSKIPDPYFQNIKSAILALAYNPRPSGYIKLKGREAFRIRVNHYRIIYEIHDDLLLVDVVTVSHRKDVYK